MVGIQFLKFVQHRTSSNTESLQVGLTTRNQVKVISECDLAMFPFDVVERFLVGNQS